MKKKAKSSLSDLQSRGFATEDAIKKLHNTPQKELIALLHSDCAISRTSAARNLSVIHTDISNTLNIQNASNISSISDIPNIPNIPSIIAELLKQLSVEKCLYTKIAICESLEKGATNSTDKIDTARKMTAYLGKIGTNQHKTLPETVSKKKSFPLPRDIIARSLGKMDIVIFPVLLEVIHSRDICKISEVLDAIGYMVFYNPILATSGTSGTSEASEILRTTTILERLEIPEISKTSEALKNTNPIFALVNTYAENPLILWKVLLCLSAFPLEESRLILSKFASKKNERNEADKTNKAKQYDKARENNLLNMEAQRSLDILKARNSL